MIKKSITAQQVVKMNRLDFDKAGGGKKAGFSFSLEYKNGRVNNRYTSQLAKELVEVLQGDDAVMVLMNNRTFQLEMNPKCEMKITMLADQPTETSSTEAGETDMDTVETSSEASANS
jgi:hypothetical protein